MHRLLPVLAIAFALIAPWFGGLILETPSSGSSSSEKPAGPGAGAPSSTSNDSGCSIDPWGGCY